MSLLLLLRRGGGGPPPVLGAAEYQHGTHALAIHSSTSAGYVFPSVQTTAIAAAAVRATIIAAPQYPDSNQPSVFSALLTAPNSPSTPFSAGPQYDLNVTQAVLTVSVNTQSTKPVPSLYAAPQADPSQLAAVLSAPPLASFVPNFMPQGIIVSGPQADPTQISAVFLVPQTGAQPPQTPAIQSQYATPQIDYSNPSAFVSSPPAASAVSPAVVYTLTAYPQIDYTTPSELVIPPALPVIITPAIVRTLLAVPQADPTQIFPAFVASVSNPLPPPPAPVVPQGGHGSGEDNPLDYGLRARGQRPRTWAEAEAARIKQEIVKEVKDTPIEVPVTPIEVRAAEVVETVTFSAAEANEAAERQEMLSKALKTLAKREKNREIRQKLLLESQRADEMMQAMILILADMDE